ncbi:Vesicular glutamate transporter 2 [Acropora cervicornis]|uniref:Vesicular glutamate transporter 2 n=1 Tax=Acropora cervicornis TaxID=6130 RepID=A0AAD9VGP6_ACRCE|nr:Vesicular glutamate transporter 2 [Acropora cervicornis]
MDKDNSKEKIPLQHMSTYDDQLFSSSGGQTTQVNGDGHRCYFFTKRCLISILALLGFCNVYALRVNLSVAIVAMVDKKRIQGAEGKVIEEPAEFYWNSEEQALRVFIGLCEGVVFPANHAVWTKWAPPLERSTLTTVAASGSHIGTVIAMPLSGLLAQHLGWTSVFYVFGKL